MTIPKPIVALTVFASLGIATYGGYWWAGQQPVAGFQTDHQAPASAPPAESGERKVLYWHDPMYPQQKFDKPGKSPFMDMDLVPVYADQAVQGNTIRIDPAMTHNLGVRTVAAKTGTFWRKVDTVGTVQADERRISVLQSRAAGWLEKLYLRAVDDPVRRGMAVAEIYAPDLLAAQEEYLLLLSQPNAGTELVAAARQRLSLLGLSDRQIDALRESGRASRRVVLHSPSSGVVTEIGAREGAAVSPGMPLVSIVDLSRVWIVAQVPEMQLAWIETGRPAEATVAAVPGDKYEGKVEYIYPGIDAQTRTVKVRFSVKNPEMRLRPGMVASVAIFGGPKRHVLLVPEEAVIRTGERSIVIVEESAGRYRAQEVAIGLVSGKHVEIVEGLKASEQVVTSGQFLIDSEASLRGSISRLSPMASGEAHAGHGGTDEHAGDVMADVHGRHDMSDKPAGHAKPVEHVAAGTIKKVEPESGRVVISHGPIASLDWPSMTMGFSVTDKGLLERMKPEQQIEFRFVKADDAYRVTGFEVKSDGIQ